MRGLKILKSWESTGRNKTLTCKAAFWVVAFYTPWFTGLGAPSFPGFSVSPLPRQCINSQPWLRALTDCVAPLMRGRPGRRRRRARATGLSPVGPPWACAEAA